MVLVPTIRKLNVPRVKTEIPWSEAKKTMKQDAIEVEKTYSRSFQDFLQETKFEGGRSEI